MKRIVIIFFLVNFSSLFAQKIQGDEQWKKDYFTSYKNSIFREKAPLLRLGAFIPGSMSSGYPELSNRNEFQMGYFLDYYFYRSKDYSGSRFSWFLRVTHSVYGYHEKDKTSNTGIDGDLKVLMTDVGFRYGYGFNLGNYYMEPYFVLAPLYYHSSLSLENKSIDKDSAGMSFGLGIEFLITDYMGLFIESNVRSAKFASEDYGEVSGVKSGYVGIVFRTK